MSRCGSLAAWSAARGGQPLHREIIGSVPKASLAGLREAIERAHACRATLACKEGVPQAMKSFPNLKTCSLPWP